MASTGKKVASIVKQVINKRGTICVEEVPEPVCGLGEVKVALTHSLISAGTELRSVDTASKSLASRAKERPDLVRKVIDRAKNQGIMAAYRAVREKLDEPKPLGYSATGVVIEVGAHVTGFAPGDRVSCGGASACHAEIVCAPENLVVRVPEGVPAEAAAFATVGSIAMQGVRRARPEFGETFVVFGLGLVGQLCVQFAKAAGVRVVGFDLAPDRVALARDLGADAAYVLTEVDPIERVASFTNGLGADAAVVAAATQSSDPVNTAMAMLRERGRLSIVGVVGLQMAWGPFYAKELDIHMSRSYGPGRYDPEYEIRGMAYPPAYVRWTENANMGEVLRLIAEGRLKIALLTSAVYTIDEAAKAYAALQQQGPKPLGVLLAHSGSSAPRRPVEVPKNKARREVRSPIRVAVIGCGAFAKNERLPYLGRMEGFRLERLVSLPAPQLKQIAEQYGVKKYSTDYREALADPDVDLLVVATPHSLHAPIAMDASEAGKDLLVEKPMAVNEEELERVYAALKASGVRYACGFNRRFAPASKALKRFVEERGGPCQVVYRANVGLVPPGSWMHAPEEGGGRIVGEACHFFDYANWLVGAEPISVSGTTMSYTGDRFVASDNLSAVVKYADGSLATIIYCTTGHGGLNKERVEAFAGGAAAVLDDFTALSVHGAKMAGWAGAQDKGHKGLMEAVATALASGADIPIGLEASYAGMKLTFKAMEAARTGSFVSM